MIQGWLPDSLHAAEFAAAAASAAVTAAVLLNVILRLCCGKKQRRQIKESAVLLQAPHTEEKQNGMRRTPQQGAAEQGFDLLELADSLKKRFQDPMEQRGVRLLEDFPEIDAPCVTGDREGLAGTLETFLNYTYEDAGTREVRILFRQMYRDPEKINLMVRIRDIGGERGIAQAERLVRNMDGQVTVSRIPEGGYDFSVFLTLKIQKGSRPDEG
ncbi:MAG: hypothetical protein MR868_05025 [Lachnospiraceae bacterium]|nr:hypothetical protein [Lachnospiraceae bacterium]